MPLPAELVADLCAQGEQAFADFTTRCGDLYHPFVYSDYQLAYRALSLLAAEAQTFLEWGSGVGTVTILADLLGYEAHGIEQDPRLLEQAEALASRFGSSASFAEGSYVPTDLQEEIDLQSTDFLTTTEGEPAYARLGMELSDFDLIYVFPWPGEEELHLEIMRRHARADALLLTYGATDGVLLYRGTEPAELGISSRVQPTPDLS